VSGDKDGKTAGKAGETPQDSNFEDEFDSALDAARQELSRQAAVSQLRVKRLESWEGASSLVKEFRPVPWLVWQVVRGVFGKKDIIGSPHPQAFSVLDRLITQAAVDPSFETSFSGATTKVPLSDAVGELGPDVAGALCYIHAICRRVGHLVAERIWRPIIDDALIRARIGYYVGGYCKPFGRGRGMLAGFSGRSGLAILIASGDLEQAKQILEALATGVDINEAGLRIYSCEPLQVAALTLTASGCARDAALGTSSFSDDGEGIELGTEKERSEQYRWLAAFSICELLRIGKADLVKEDHWRALFITQALKEEILAKVKILNRRGHSWAWITWPQVAMERSS